MDRAATTDYLSYLGARTLLAALGVVPKPAALAMATSLALAFSLFDGRHKQIARVNLRIAFPEWSDRERERVVRASYRNLARLAVEITRFHRLTPQNIDLLASYDDNLGLENFLRARRKGRGVLFFTGHFSSWELLPYAHALHGRPLSFVVRPLDNPYLEKLMDGFRNLGGNRTLPKRFSTRRILEVLARKECVGILNDQNVIHSEGDFVPFFGRAACTTTSVARFALKTGAPVVPGRIQWRPQEKRYRILFWPEVELVKTGNHDADVLANTRRYNATLEEMIRLDPDSWLWGHKRWNSRPPEDPDNPYHPLR